MFRFFKVSLVGLLLLSFSLTVFSQSANVRGFVYTKDNGEPVLFTNVYLKGTTIGASTDVNGFFSITKIPPGTYTLMISFMGYDSLTESITVKANDIINKKYYLIKGAIQLEEVVLTAEQQSKKEDTKVSVQKIDPIAINKLPSVGEPDLAQYMQVLPGVVFTGDQGGQLYIRGGTPVQNKVLLDGMIVYNPFHSIGLFSVFDNDIIRNADVYTGGFGAEYGGRVSSVMDISTRDGNKKRISGKVSASTFGAKVLVEGPLKKLRDDGQGSSSFLFSSKTSYLPQSSKLFYQYVDPAGLPFSFSDHYGKISLNGVNGSKINLFGFNFSDKVDYKNIASFNWKSFGGGSNFVLIPNNSSTLIEGNFSYSQYGIVAKPISDSARSSNINSFNGGLKFSTFIGKNEIKYGFEVIGFSTDYKYRDALGLSIDQQAYTTEVAGFVKYKFVSKNKKAILEPSFRLHYYSSLEEVSPEPRLAAKYNITDAIRVKFAGGMYSQNLIAANSDRDVVNLFYGFLSGPDNLQDTYSPKPGAAQEDLNTKLQKANHLIGGVEFDLFKHIEINIEAYQKRFTHLTNVNRDKLFEDDPQHSQVPDNVKKDFIVETGYVRGADLVIKYDRKRFYFWAVYSLTYNKRWDGFREYFPVWDRRHNLNLVSSYTFGKKKNWEINARWNFGSGFPFTKTQGFFPKLNFNNNLNIDYTTLNGSIGYIPSDSLNSGRLPAYHRLDVNIKYRYKWTERVTFEGSAGVTNSYNRQNLFYFDRITYSRKNQLPFLPSVNFSLTF